LNFLFGGFASDHDFGLEAFICANHWEFLQLGV
jgi:hypothetical protein